MIRSKLDWFLRATKLAKERVRAAGIMGIVLAMVLFLNIPNLILAAGIQIVSPGMYEELEAPGKSWNLRAGGVIQQLFPATDFQSLSPEIQTITQMTLRPSRGLGEQRTVIYENLVMRMSTTATSLPNLSLTFADNMPQDTTIVIDGNVTISTANQGPPNGPREFDYIFQLETPFHYNPSAGNLIMEMRWTGLSQDGDSGHKGDFVLDTSTAAQFLYKEGDSLATTAEYNLGGDVWQFTFVPEPTTLLLGAMAVMGMVIRRRSLR